MLVVAKYLIMMKHFNIIQFVYDVLIQPKKGCTTVVKLLKFEDCIYELCIMYYKL